MLTRRVFLRGSAVVMAGVGAAPSWLARAAEATEGKKKILVAIFQRGAADGLNIVVPFSEKRYYELRPTIAVPVARRAERVHRPGWTLSRSTPQLQALEGLCGTNSNWRSSTPPVRPIRRARTSMRRTTWSPARPARPPKTGGSIAL